MRRRQLIQAIPAVPIILSATDARAQAAWPARGSIRWVVGFPPGGFSDAVARLLAQPVGAAIGQNIVIENRPGAGATVGADHVAKSPPDGYTFTVTHVSPHGTAAGVFPQLPYDVINDFTHLAMICETPTAIMVRRDSPLRNMQDFLDAIRGPGLRYGTSGIGSIGHLQGELLTRVARATRYEHVPYRGTAPAVQDLLGGVIETVFDPLATQLPQVTGNGPMRVLVVSNNTRVPGLPDVPTLTETGLGEVTATAWMGLSGPKNLPAPIAARMTEALVAALARPELRARMEELTVFPPATPMTGAAFTSFIRDFSTKWTAVARSANIVAS
jgi:tripartite-type tricarboxylate transporter receptor subunit TctC